MKMKKKLAMLVLTVCMTVSSFSMSVFAADGKIMFTDPTTAVGETLEVKGVLTSSTDIEDREVVMEYDTTMLKFKNGDSVTETSDGQITYNVSGQRDGNRVEFMMYFDVLAEGTTKLEVVSYQAWDTSNTAINCQQGYSTITIEAGEVTVDPEDPDTTPDPEVPVSDTTVIMDGNTFNFSSDFSESDIPAGFVQSAIAYNGVQCQVAVEEVTGTCLAYLVDAEGVGEFYIYNVETASFTPFEMIAISNSTSIILLSDTESIKLPEQYMATTVTVNGNVFPAWQNIEDSSLCVLYALNSNGAKSLYQYDSAEGTYQRFQVPAVTDTTDSTENEGESMFGTLIVLLEDNLDYVVLGTGLGFILFIIIIIVLSVKLYNRNAELDELYEEYGLDEEEEDSEEDEFEEVVEEAIEENPEEDAVEEETAMETDFIVSFEDEESFEEIEEVLDEDIVEFVEEEDSDIEVEFYEQAILEETEEILEEESEIFEEDEVEFFDDDDDIEYEFDFIDLDD